MDRMQFHWNKAPKWMRDNGHFWNPLVTWKNKYEDGNPKKGMTFKGRFLTGLTDGWHLLKMLMKFMIIAAIVSYPGSEGIVFNTLLLRLIIDPVLLYLAFQGGFKLTYK